jgi:hypothetical protein
VKWTFHLVEQISDIVEIQSGTALPELTRADHKRLPLVRLRVGEPTSKRLVDHVAEGAAGSADQQFQFCRDIIVQRQGRAHIMMLS